MTRWACWATPTWPTRSARANAVEHAAIVDAIVRRDADGADRLTRAHIRSAHTARVKRLFAPGAP